MCTYQTETVEIQASVKLATGWTAMTDASVYFDHPTHYPAGHALMIDLRNPAKGPSARVALELHPDAARSLANAILRSLDTAPKELLSEFAS